VHEQSVHGAAGGRTCFVASRRPRPPPRPPGLPPLPRPFEAAASSAFSWPSAFGVPPNAAAQPTSTGAVLEHALTVVLHDLQQYFRIAAGHGRTEL